MKIFHLLLSIIIFSCSAFGQISLLKKADKAHFIDKNYEKSLGLYRKAAKRNNNNEMAFNGIGMALFRLGRYEESLASYNKAIEINRFNIIVYTNRANVLNKVGMNKEALNDLDFVLKVNPSDSVALNSRGMVKNALKDHDGAINDYTKAIKLGLPNYNVFNNLGVVYWQKGELDSAAKYFEKTLVIESGEPNVYVNCGSMLLESLNSPHKALSFFRKAIDIGIKGDEAFFKLAHCYHLTGQYVSAEIYYAKAIGENSNYANSFYNRGTVRAYLSKYDSAIKDFDSALSIDSAVSGVYTNRALLVYDKLQNYELAIADIKRAIHIEESKGSLAPFGYNNLGYLQYKKGDLTESLKNIKFSISLDSTNSYAFKNLALVYLQLNKFDDGCKAAKRAIELGFLNSYGEEILEVKKRACLDE